MSVRRRATMSVDELASLGVSTDVATAGRALGLSRDHAYDLARTGELAPGVPVLRVGRQYVVPTAPLRRALGIDAPVPVEPTGE
jgi:hypothetical protein